MKTAQEVFDHVVAHLRKQKVRSVSADGSCKYRGPNGLMCAFGCLIPDDLYHSTFEGMNVRYFFGGSCSKESGLSASECDAWNSFDSKHLAPFEPMLLSLQSLHDDKRRFDFWEDGFVKIAERYDVKYTVPIEE